MEREGNTVFLKSGGMKGKPLLPTLRTKKRYVVYEVIADARITHRQVYKAIINSFKECFGVFDLGKSGLIMVYDQPGMLKVHTKYLNHLKTSMAMITQIEKQKVILNIVRISGILRKAKLGFRGY